MSCKGIWVYSKWFISLAESGIAVFQDDPDAENTPTVDDHSMFSSCESLSHGDQAEEDKDDEELVRFLL